MEGEIMRAVASAARRPPAEIPAPPTHQEHEVTVRLHHHVFELAEWAYRFEQGDGVHHLEGRSFEAFLADVLEAGLELPVERWRRATE
jgi:hypothetical protein